MKIWADNESDSARRDFLEVAADACLDGRWSVAMAVLARMAIEAPAKTPPKPGNWVDSPFGTSASYTIVAGSDIAGIADDLATWDDPKDAPGHQAILAYGESGDTCAAIVRLHGGHYLSFYAWSDVTGSSFHGDAYGGNGDIFIHSDPGECLKFLDEDSRSMLRWA